MGHTGYADARTPRSGKSSRLPPNGFVFSRPAPKTDRILTHSWPFADDFIAGSVYTVIQVGSGQETLKTRSSWRLPNLAL